jgi:hypothetical protein
VDNQPHLGVANIGISEFASAEGEDWYVHRHCPDAPKDKKERWHILSLDCYSIREKLLCEGCGRRYGKRALEYLKAHLGSTYEFNSLEGMQKYAAENDTKAYHAHAAYHPPKLESPPLHL